jgi:hypothetical protein
MRMLAVAGWSLVAAQVVHGVVPAETSAEGDVGFFTGIVLLLASLVGASGAMLGKAWAAPVLGWTGAIVAVGFLLYHVVPVTSPVTNPYPGEGVGVAPWLTVAACVAAGAWCAVLALRPTPDRRGVAAA